jgi:toluene monooxygenase system ferredoxin subunit
VDKTRLCRAEECPRDGMKTFEAADGLKVLVAHTGGQYVGYQALCPHMEVALEEGFYDGSVITCHQHLWQWEAWNGAPLGLAEAPLLRYELCEEDGVLYVMMPSGPR